VNFKANALPLRFLSVKGIPDEFPYLRFFLTQFSLKGFNLQVPARWLRFQSFLNSLISSAIL